MSVRRTAGPRGLTLVELLIATAIVSFAMLGVASMFPAALRSVIAGGETTKATMLVQAMTDIIRSEPFDILHARYDSLDTRAISASCPLDETAAPPPYDDYTKKKWTCDLLRTGAQDSGRGLPGAYGQVRVECVDANGATASCASPASRLRRVTVTVLWGGSNVRSVSMVTHVARIR
jgi:prepilin-type N-terminal cleavage/methylation domain-containing protein